MAMQTLKHKLRRQVLGKGIDYAGFIQYGLTLESSSTQEDTIEKDASTINRVTRSDRKTSHNHKPDTHSKWDKRAVIHTGNKK